MIPKYLRLQNFLSYQETSLDFQGLHVACVAGPNGAGKSSLLEAIAWAIWGHSRVVAEDDVILLGAVEAQVDFTFEHQQRFYRIVRSRRRNQGGSLEFQVKAARGFRPLTQRGMRATQQLITNTLRLDYETFVNSAYLRQGRADEFMLKRPSERKQILADLLKLEQYDHLAERAKEKSRESKASVAVLTTSLESLTEQVEQRSAIAQTAQRLALELEQLQQQQLADQQTLAAYQAQQQEYQNCCQRQSLVQQKLAHVAADCDRLHQAAQQAQEQLHDLATILADTDTIEAGLQTLKRLQSEEERLAAQFAQLQELQLERDRQQQVYQTQAHTLQTHLQAKRLQLANLDQQLTELKTTQHKKEQVAVAMAELQQARHQLQRLDQLQLQVSPLKQRQHTLQRQVDQTQAELTARLTAIDSAESQLQQQQARQPQLQQAVLEVSYTLEELTAKRTYQEKVREKGIERRHFMERLQAEQRSYEVQLAHLDQKLQLLKQPGAACPLCDRPLEQHHWDTVLATQHQEQEELQRQIWVIREQLAVSEREIQVLRQEYRELEDALTIYEKVLEQRGSLLAQLDSTESVTQQLQVLEQEHLHLQRCLAEQTYAQDSQTELQQITDQLSELHYDERDHALLRGQVDRLRWAEIRQVEIRQAERKQSQLMEQRPLCLEAITAIEAEIAALAESDIAVQIAQLTQHMAELDYDLTQHQHVRSQLQVAQGWRLQVQKLTQARQAHPRACQQVQTLTQQHQQTQQLQQQLSTELTTLTRQLQQYPDLQTFIEALQQQLRDRQQTRERILSQTGALQQQLNELDRLQAQLTQQQQTLGQVQRHLTVHQELAQAFGRNGLQALLIEHVLPQLEAETNHILGRLSAHQLHVQFVTQRTGRGRQGKLIDTLDILIADAEGTRPYETYSGGEAFRVNFAIRLALARLLAQRSGTPLQMLIIDEGFGTQDREGCDRLIAAITAIASDFACILAVTHIPHFREAFQTRIDVLKTSTGSQLSISM